jgi:hypothetical protein
MTVARRALVLLAALAPLPAAAQRDVPAGHWASEPVAAMVRLGVMPLTGGRFNGSAKVTRAQMVGIVSRMARSLEAGKWAGEQPQSPSTGKVDKGPLKGPVTRYDLAAAAYRIGVFTARALPAFSGKATNVSEALVRAAMPAKPAAGPLRTELAFLVANRFVHKGSPLLKADAQPLTGLEASRAFAEMIGGLNARRTDEPEKRIQLERPGGDAHTHEQDKPKP